MSSVITIENLYKEYHLGTIGYDTIRKDLESWWARFRGQRDPNSIIGHENKHDQYTERILALNDIPLKSKKVSD